MVSIKTNQCNCYLIATVNFCTLTFEIMSILLTQGPGFKKSYQMHLKSQSGPIHVLLVNKDTEETSPVVVQVPPPKEEDESQNVDPNQATSKAKLVKVGDGKLTGDFPM